MLNSQSKDKTLARRSRGVGEGFGPAGEITILPPSVTNLLLGLRKVSHTREWTFGDQMFEDLTHRSIVLTMKKVARLAVKPPPSHFRNFYLGQL